MRDVCNSQAFDPALVNAALAIARRFASGSDAEDIAQIALLKLVLVKHAIDHPVAWLYVVIARLAARRSRALARSPTLTLMAAPPATASVDPRRQLDLEIDVRHIIGLLPKRERECIRLVMCGQTADEIAARLKCSVKSVEKSIADGRRRLRRIYHPGGGRDGSVRPE